MKMAQEQENLFADTYQAQIQESPHRSFDSPAYAVDGGNISYYTDKGELHISGNLSRNVNHLLPQLYRSSDGTYECGSSVGYDKDFVMKAEHAVVKNLAMEHLVYKDIMQRKEKGGSLLSAEQDFVQSFSERLADEGLSIDAKGNLKQKDPRYKNTLSNSASHQSSY